MDEEPSFKITSKARILRLPINNGLGAVHPHAIYNVFDGEYPFWLYYTPYPPDEAELPYLVRSRDGYVFTDRDVVNPLIMRGSNGEWDDHHLADEDVIYYHGKWYMFFAGACYRDHVKKVSIGLALSNDGIHWRKFEENPVIISSGQWWDRGYGNVVEVSCPTGIVIDDKLYLYYASLDENGVYNIALAVSDNFIDYEVKGVVLKPTSIWESRGINHPYIARYRDYLILLYVTYDGIQRYLGIAYTYLSSPDRFVKLEKPLLSPNPLYHRSFFKKIRSINMKALALLYRYYKPRYNLRLPTWKDLYLYRSSLLTKPDRELYFIEEDETLLYVSGYSGLFGTPSIGVYNVRIGIG